MKAATCVADITPQTPVYLAGYVGEARKHPAQGVHDAPLAVSLLLETESTSVLFLSNDTLAISGEKATVIRKRIHEVMDIEDDHIIINGIHSHSLPNAFMGEELFGTPDCPQYFVAAVDQIIMSITTLSERLVDVDASIGTGKIHGFYSKRSDIHAPFEDNAAIVKFTHNDQVVAAMCNFNCHATVLGPQNMLITSDIIGEVRHRLSEDLGVIPYTFTGASGDISNRQYRQGNDFDELARVGAGIHDLFVNIKHYEPTSLNNISIQTYDHHIAYDNRSYYDEYKQDIAEAEAILAKSDLPVDEWKLRTSEKMALENKLKMETVDFHVRGIVLQCDDFTIVTFPGELASKFGLELRNRCQRKHFLLIGYTDGYQGYFIEAEEYGRTYETKASNTPKGESERIVSEIGDFL